MRSLRICEKCAEFRSSKDKIPYGYEIQYCCGIGESPHLKECPEMYVEKFFYEKRDMPKDCDNWEMEILNQNLEESKYNK